MSPSSSLKKWDKCLTGALFIYVMKCILAVALPAARVSDAYQVVVHVVSVIGYPLFLFLLHARLFLSIIQPPQSSQSISD